MACWSSPGRAHAKLLQKLTDTDLVERGLPLALGKADLGRPDRASCAPGEFRRRARLRAAPPDRDAERLVRSSDAGGRGVRHQALRHQGHALDGGREILSPRRTRAVDRICGARIRPRPLRASNKGEFLGRDALVHWREKGFANRFVTLELDGVTDTDARGSEPIRRNGEIVGRCTSGGYGWRVRKSLALAMVRPDLGEIGSELEVTLLGKPHRAIVIAGIALRSAKREAAGVRKTASPNSWEEGAERSEADDGPPERFARAFRRDPHSAHSPRNKSESHEFDLSRKQREMRSSRNRRPAPTPPGTRACASP